MKLSVSLPDEDVVFLDRFAAARALPSRSAALQQAIHALRTANLAGAYDAAWAEWSASDDAGAWDSAGADGL